jgi:hypothetical protein
LPHGSAERQSPLFRDIEGEWANAMIQAAAEEGDLVAKRALLDQISKSTTVDAARRSRALELLEALPKEGVEIEELPETQPNAVPSPSQPAQDAAAKPPAKPPKIARPQTAPAPAVKAPNRGSKPAAGSGQTKSPTLVRDDPFASD